MIWFVNVFLKHLTDFFELLTLIVIRLDGDPFNVFLIVKYYSNFSSNLILN